MKLTLFKIIKLKDGEETVVLSTNDELEANEQLEELNSKSTDDEFYFIVED